MMAKARRRPATPAPAPELIETPTPDPEFERRTPGIVNHPEWAQLWKHFGDMHTQWCAKHVGEEPVYALPDSIIQSLSGALKVSGRKQPPKPLIREADVKAERHFATICRRFEPGTIGVWRGLPVIYRLMMEHWLALPMDADVVQMLIRQEMVEEEYHRRIKSPYRPVWEPSDHQMLGYLGYLRLNERFNEELAKVRGAWKTMNPKKLNVASTGLRYPGVTLGPLARHPLPVGHKRPGRLAKIYQEMLLALCRRWYLRELVTWDLAVPWPPFSVASVFDIWLLVDRRAPVFFHAPYCKLPTDAELHAKMKHWRRTKRFSSFVDTRREDDPKSGPEELPLSKLTGQEGHASEYETVYRMSFVEKTAEVRYGPAHGMTSRLLEGFRGVHKLGSMDSVRKLRARYAHLLSHDKPEVKTKGAKISPADH